MASGKLRMDREKYQFRVARRLDAMPRLSFYFST